MTASIPAGLDLITLGIFKCHNCFIVWTSTSINQNLSDLKHLWLIILVNFSVRFGVLAIFLASIRS